MPIKTAISNVSSRIGALLTLCAFWEVYSHISGNPIIPPFSAALGAINDMLITGELTRHIGATLLHVGLGFGVAVILGIVGGCGITLSTPFRRVFLPVIDALRGISVLSLFPLIILIFGLGIEAKAFAVFWLAFPAILINVSVGIESVDRAVIEAALLETKQRTSVLFTIQLPLALGHIAAGLRIAFAGALLALTAAEMLGGSAGLGYLVMESAQTFHYARMFAGIMVTAALSFAVNAIFLWVQSICTERIRS